MPRDASMAPGSTLERKRAAFVGKPAAVPDAAFRGAIRATAVWLSRRDTDGATLRASVLRPAKLVAR